MEPWMTTPVSANESHPQRGLRHGYEGRVGGGFLGNGINNGGRGCGGWRGGSGWFGYGRYRGCGRCVGDADFGVEEFCQGFFELGFGDTDLGGRLGGGFGGGVCCWF